jgi:hypothetical protein
VSPPSHQIRARAPDLSLGLYLPTALVSQPHAGVSVVEDKEFIPGWVAVEATSVDLQPVFRIRDGEEEEEEEEEAGFLEHAGSSALESLSPSEVTQGSVTWCEGHGLNRWRQEFDQARGVIRTKLAIKDSWGALVLRKPPPPPEDEEGEFFQR